MASPAFPLTRANAFERLDSFLPAAAGAYARLRNKDKGQGQHQHVSRLSAALRRRLITEQEVVSAVLNRHDLGSAEKYVSEVFWRTYWKGWLEQRPTVWEQYLVAVKDALSGLEASPGQKARHAAATNANTGIDCFDAWAVELQETGYLHNWARMQFASIWIFTLGLPWELGAAYMFDRLMDADPASNTLSWRWVAGLHTAGKAYLADPERIRAMTDGRYVPSGLARQARIPADTLRLPSPTSIRTISAPDPDLATMLLVTTEDLSVETMAVMRALPVKAIAFMEGRNEWDRIALDDAVARLTQTWHAAVIDRAPAPSDLAAAAKAAGCTQIATAFLPAGPVATALQPYRSEFARSGLIFAESMRDWDRNGWPHCRKGFFALKEKIPALVRSARP
ncbi:deoxyribodipyrimidine photolyase [Rhizobium sp. AQ_MP]|uniref:FAD-binding domain-containing protein n=1 Tax=Rhizobium sp. AQ_MP TaxID=2761536 RepID=UPI00163B5A6E|nr:FAD-binding domain-containing protein [Rhizobium sp. AQ_MP]MBC2775223.1 deoxyribodipyrimidine photolyase [Rhizobium sp. AQ_MP]